MWPLLVAEALAMLELYWIVSMVFARPLNENHEELLEPRVIQVCPRLVRR